MNNPRISIITPSFNRADVVEETARSIFNQSYSDWEWVIVDDGSTDNSWAVLESFARRDSRVKIYRRDREPKGACTCRNIGVEKSTGDYLLFLDTDDVLASYCLSNRLSAMQEDPGYDFIIFPMLLFKKKVDDLKLLWNIDKAEDDLLRVLKGDAICQGTGTLWKKQSFQKVGMWNEELRLWQDVELHIRSFLFPVRYKKRMDMDPDVYLRISDDSLSRVSYHSEPKLHSRIKVYKYAIEHISVQQQLSKYMDGLKVMGIDVIISAINGRLYHEAEDLLEVSSRHGIFNKHDLKKVRHYMRARRAKLYKIPILYNIVDRRAKEIAPIADVTIGIIKWPNQ